jgi:hypothetical protein
MAYDSSQEVCRKHGVNPRTARRILELLWWTALKQPPHHAKIGPLYFGASWWVLSIALRELTAQAVLEDMLSTKLATSAQGDHGSKSDVWRHEDALAASAQVVAILRALAAGETNDIFSKKPALGVALTRHSGCLTEAEHHKAALTASQEAVATYASLRQTRPDRFRPNFCGSLLPDLAAALSRESCCLVQVGCDDSALIAGNRAMAIGQEIRKAREDGIAKIASR